MRRLRIAYIINSVEGGGAAMPVPAIASALRDAGADLRVLALTGRDQRALPGMIEAGLDVELRADGESDHLRALKWLDRAVSSMKPDVIWTSLTRATLLGQLVGSRRRIPVISWQHAAFLRPANKRLLRMSKGLTSLWIADSSTVNAFTQRELGVSSERVVTWPLFAADPDAPRASPWRPGKKVQIGSLGRLHPVKGYDVLVQALALIGQSEPRCLDQIEVRIAGDGDDRSRLASLAESAGVTNISFQGFSPEPQRFLTELHLYVQPSRSEGFCVAAHEAMQAALPVIASDVGEMTNSIVSGETGILLPPGDPASLAEAILSCVRNPARLETMGVAGRKRLLSRFSDEQFRRGATEIVGRLGRLVGAN